MSISGGIFRQGFDRIPIDPASNPCRAIAAPGYLIFFSIHFERSGSPGLAGFFAA